MRKRLTNCGRWGITGYRGCFRLNITASAQPKMGELYTKASLMLAKEFHINFPRSLAVSR
jgi:hypothetical protein